MHASGDFTEHKEEVWRWGILAAFLMVVFLSGYVLNVVYGSPQTVSVEVPAGLSRVEIADLLGEELSWNQREKGMFASTYAQMHWAALNTHLVDPFAEAFDWGEDEREVFLTSSTQYFMPEYDFLSTIYVPGIYMFSEAASKAQIANTFVTRLEETDSLQEFISVHIESEAAENVAEFVQREVELLPDLVPAPAQDLAVEDNGVNVYLRFSTTYFNQGEGPLELRADPETAGIAEDIERTVFQRIYRQDGEFRDRPAGVFLWHQPHLHYHFADFVVYDLEADTEEALPDLAGSRTKSTFCIRDVSRVDLELEHAATDAGYRICGKELQGISVGWGDTYFYTYADQYLDITDLPSGTYKLSFIVNPEHRFEELRTDNNTSSVTFELDMEEGIVELISEVPENSPELEHVYPDD